MRQRRCRPLVDQVALELGGGRDRCEEKPAHARGHVDHLADAHEAGAPSIRSFNVAKRKKKPSGSKKLARTHSSRSKNSALDVKAQDRRTEALRYRIMGYTFEQIGEAMGFARARAWELVDEEMRARSREQQGVGNQLRMIMLERYERMINRLWKLCYPVDGGVDLQALDRLIHVQEHISRMCGLHEPQRVVLDIRAADNMVMTFANISLRYIPEQNREAFVAEVRALVEQVTREHEAKAGLAVIGRVG